jgi:hypothetical protein
VEVIAQCKVGVMGISSPELSSARSVQVLDRSQPTRDAIVSFSDGVIRHYFSKIVDRQSGGILGGIRDGVLGRNGWFALYPDDDNIDDETFVDGVRRGQFRLHPLGPLGISTGCVVIQNRSDFDHIRSYLISGGLELVPGTQVRAYGTLDVGRLVDTLDPQYRGGGGDNSSAVA